MTTTDRDDIPVVERYVYLGRRMDGTKAFHAYLAVEHLARAVPADMNDLGAKYYAKPLNDFASIGQVVEVTFSDDTRRSIWTTGEHRPRIVAPEDMPSSEWPNDDRVAAWIAADRAARVIIETIRTDRRLARESGDPLHAALDVVRDAYRAQRGIASRAAFIRYVEEYIHS